MAQQTAFQYSILAVLHREGPIHGLGAKEELPGDVNHPTLYINLDKLVNAGLVEKSEKDKRTNEYALTDDGVATLIDRVQELGGKME